MHVKLSTLPLVIVCCIGCGDASFQIEIPKSTLQSKTEEWFPISTKDSDKQLPIEAVLSDPKILLEPGSDKIGFQLSIQVTPEGPLRKPASSPAGPAPPIGPGGPPLPGPLGKQPVRQGNSQPSGTIDGVAIVHGGIRYESSDGKIYVDDATVTKLQFDNLPKELGGRVTKTVEAVMKKYLAENAVYQLDEKDMTSKLAKSVLKSITINDGALLIKVGI